MRGTIEALDELFATLSYDKPRVIVLHFKISEGYTLLMLITTFASCLILCKNYGW
ncbi:isopentenyl-diphosphate delta-isomerase [Escherichia coli]|nr:isopentenyl-diphosphate delta-isomerase [Escherichia coli]NZA91068.1 isopentenyl-diphosphate delta-isomerase [Escherichia coli]